MPCKQAFGNSGEKEPPFYNLDKNQEGGLQSLQTDAFVNLGRYDTVTWMILFHFLIR